MSDINFVSDEGTESVNDGNLVRSNICHVDKRSYPHILIMTLTPRSVLRII